MNIRVLRVLVIEGPQLRVLDTLLKSVVSPDKPWVVGDMKITEIARAEQAWTPEGK